MRSIQNTAPTSPDSPDLLDFIPQPMEPWYNPQQLARTGLRTIIAALFGAYSDKREMQACLDQGKPYLELEHAPNENGIWIDYVSDLGSGFNSTYSIAYLLGQETLQLGEITKRGNVLVMGGDQVYPVPNSEQYNNRLIGPYKSARSYIPDNEAPRLFAIPGNHDWYDGLTSFLKVFCQKRWIGGWKTEQSRSYFAIKLPYNWWIWGIDIQLSEDIDKPQQEFFEKVNRKFTKTGDKVILCTAEPSWVYQAYKNKDKSFLNLEWFTQEYITNPKNNGLHQLELPLTLTGDLHHYSSYYSNTNSNETHPEQWKITAGGGGAFLHPTHHLPLKFKEDQKLLNHFHGTPQKEFTASSFYPAQNESRKLVIGNLRFPFLNPWFSSMMGALYLFFSWILASASGVSAGSASNTWTFRSEIFLVLAKNCPSWSNLIHVFLYYADEFAHHPFLDLFILLLCYGFYSFSDKNHKGMVWAGKISGLLHALVQLVCLLTIIWLWAFFTKKIESSYLIWQKNLFWYSLLSNIVLFSLAWIISGIVMGIYFIITNGLLGIHETEAFSAMRIPNFKNFIRMHLTESELKIYPVKVEKSVKKWEYQAGINNGEPWFKPANPESIQASLIEGPLIIKNKII